ncbi:TonB-dependent receptor [Parahaliea mediterranea]|uniref:TonB-dependent receptor n=1 Tax=Parahaliea mediterranea TaxID=651086 RepID=A0A939DIF0_9GAMM|nr:TonB-dependent receptor [Parahaliea mediterranea]MBN7798741.1 TonB-dependent receptor [Parahaliea mediterranea]
MSATYRSGAPLLVLAALTASPPGLADAPAGGAGAPDSERLPIAEIVVKGQIMDRAETAFSATRFDATALREQKISQPEQIFDQVPGMSIRDYGLSGVANSFSIRGFGDGGHGGDLGVVIDGIPLNEAMSHADGYVDLNVIVPLEVGGMTVFKGPVSSLYGNYNRGGLVKVDTRKGGDYRDLDVSGGSDGLLDIQGAVGLEPAPGQALNLALQHYQSDGFRPRSDTRRDTLSGRWAFPLGADTRLALSGRWHDADSDSASYLTEADYRRDPYGINANVQNDGAEKSFATLRADLSHQLSSNLQLLGFLYGTEQDFSRWFSRPVGGGQWRQREESYDREVAGAGISLNGQHEAGGTPLTWVAGVESYREATDYVYYDGLDRRQRTGPAINDRRTELDSVSAFAELQAEWHPLFQPSLGLRYDRFDGDCRKQGPETGTSPCSELNDLDNLSPKLGLRSDWTDNLVARASWSEGFALPSGWIKYQSEAANLDPVTFRQLEAGITWTPIETLELDLALFEVDSDGEVRTVDTGIYENYGETERRGLEASAAWQPHPSLSLSAVYGVNDSEVLKNADPGLVGKEVGGVSDYSATLQAGWAFLPDWRVNLIWRAVGGYALNADNSAYADSYDVVDLELDWRINPRTNLYARVDNLADEEYAPTRFMFGGENLFATGAPRQLRLGLQISL